MRISLLLLALLLAVQLWAAPPTSNPVSSFYAGADGYPAWTDQIKWDQVIDMSTYPTGNTNFEKFEAARDELAAKGGGVLYYPAGQYDFSDMPADGPAGRGLMLKSGVVIRGEAPKGTPLANIDGKLELGTKFSFGFTKSAEGSRPRNWNLIGLCPEAGKGVKDVNNVGIAWVELTGAVIYFGMDVNWGKTWAGSGSWKSGKGEWAQRVPDGTHPADPFHGGGNTYVGMGSGRLVLGCELRDAAVAGSYDGDGKFMDHFGPRVGIYASRVFVANNVLPKSKRNFLYNGVMFDYGDTCGMDINHDLLGWVRDNGNCPGYFAEGVVVRNNWVYNHGHKGYNLSGKWTVIADNHNERDYLQSGDDVYGLGRNWKLTLDGSSVSKGASDNLARAYDLAGKDLWVDGNTFNNCGSDPGNDGEGILCQLHGGTHIYSWAITHNSYDKQRGEDSYIGGYDVNCLGLLVGWNNIPSGFVGNALKASNQLADFAIVGNRARAVSPNPDAPISVKSGDLMVGKPWPLYSAPAGKLTAPKDVKAEAYQQDGIKISWVDTTECEVAFRVERSVNGGKSWGIIAYRPPQIQAHAENPPVWIDFTCPTGSKASYRVVAIGGNDTDAGASVPTAPITITTAEVVKK